jgi:CheY-like chemotaxis protein
MSQDQIDKIFHDFVQADLSTTKKYGGTGLGLSISRRFTEMLGGSISVGSEVGVGSTFVVRIPATYNPAQVRKNLARSDGNQKPKILIVDDDPDIVDMVDLYLAQEGYETITAYDGIQCLKLAEEEQPDVILLDVVMPVMDGWSALSELKENPNTKSIPVVMTSILEDSRDGVALGISDFIAKPIEWDRLNQSLNELIPHKNGQSVLIVDDDESIRKMMSAVMRKNGYRVLEAGNGKAALEVLKHNPVSLISLDLIMPEMDGFEFLAHIRKHEEWRDIPVVIMSAKELDQYETGVLEGAVEKIMSKDSSDKEDLLLEINRMVQRRVHKAA